MPRFADMLRSSYEAGGHTVRLWSPSARFQTLFRYALLAKWAGYIDQFVLFPLYLRRKLRTIAPNTLFVFSDQALGPWVPIVKTRPHVIHVHDLLALRSALDDIPENPTSATGKIYQRYIRRGFKSAKHFISVSKQTQSDLHTFGQVNPTTSSVVYNGLNFPYSRVTASTAASILRSANFASLEHGFIMHIGGSQWYKNQIGVIHIYCKYAALVGNPLPLCCISPAPEGRVQRALSEVPNSGRVYFIQNVSNITLQAAYSTARVLLFPSLAEGFGWPIIEAQACGCPVITTGEAPMTEVGGEAAIYLPRLRIGDDLGKWADHAARQLQILLEEDEDAHAIRIQKGMRWATQFSTARAVGEYLSIYSTIVNAHRHVGP